MTSNKHPFRGFCWRRLMIICLCILIAVNASETSATVDKQGDKSDNEHDNDHDRAPSWNTFATKSSAQGARKLRPETSDRLQLHRRNTIAPPKTNWTLSEKFETMLPADPCSSTTRTKRQDRESDFAERLRHEEERPLNDQSASSTTKTKSSNGSSWTIIGATASVVLATVVFFPSMVWTESAKTMNMIVSIYSLRQLFKPSDLVLLASQTVLLHPDTRAMLQTHVWPMVLSTFQSLLLAEAWSYFWKLLWKSFPTIQFNKSKAGEKTNTSVSYWLPSWMKVYWKETNGFLDRLLCRVTKRIVQKVVQKNIQQAFAVFASNGAAALQRQWMTKTSLS